jgi:hypothetical protein
MQDPVMYRNFPDLACVHECEGDSEYLTSVALGISLPLGEVHLEATSRFGGNTTLTPTLSAPRTIAFLASTYHIVHITKV